MKARRTDVISSIARRHAALIGVALIVVLAGILRLWNLSSVPPSPSLDEVSIGYNAYAILRTGRDEYGTFLPMILRAYDDWRPALYVYTVIPFELLFGVTPLAVRLPSAILGTLTVLVTYFLVLELFSHESRRTNKRITNNELPALLSVLFLAISPWHVYLSRLGHEVNLGLTVTVCAVYFFLRWLRTPDRPLALFLSAVLFAVSLGTYQSQKIIMPLLLLGLVWFGRDTIARFRRTAGTAFFLGLLISVPLVIASVTPDALIRLRTTSAFSGSDPLYVQAREQYVLSQQTGNVMGMLRYNRYAVGFRIFLSNYVSHLSPFWLFTGSARENHKVPFMGLFYIWQAPLILIGPWVLWARKYRRVLIFFLWWIAVSILPGAITTQPPHAMRTYPLVIPLVILSSVGLVALFRTLRGSRMQAVGLIVAFVVVAAGFLQLLQSYFVTFPRTQSDSFQYALSGAFSYVKQYENAYQSIVVSNEDNLYQSYMFYLFTDTVDPSTYLREGGTASGGFAETHHIGKYSFRPIRWEKEMSNVKSQMSKVDTIKNKLFIGNVRDFPSDADVIARFINLDGKDAILLVRG